MYRRKHKRPLPSIDLNIWNRIVAHCSILESISVEIDIPEEWPSRSKEEIMGRLGSTIARSNECLEGLGIVVSGSRVPFDCAVLQNCRRLERLVLRGTIELTNLTLVHPASIWWLRLSKISLEEALWIPENMKRSLRYLDFDLEHKHCCEKATLDLEEQQFLHLAGKLYDLQPSCNVIVTFRIDPRFGADEAEIRPRPEPCATIKELNTACERWPQVHITLGPPRIEGCGLVFWVNRGDW